MCKVICFSDMSRIDVKRAAQKIGEIMTDIEKDGFGYAIQGLENVFGEKCVSPKFRSRIDKKNLVKLPLVEKQYEVFGHLDKPTGPGIFHGRTSTNDKGLLNCHPMQRKDWHLIHNGVVTDHGPDYDKKTTNDSEDVLYRLIKGISEVEKYLSGYYAFCAIDPKGRLHIARDSQARLFMAWLPGKRTYIFATTSELIEKTCKALKLKYGPIEKFKDNIYAIMQGNELTYQKAINPIGYTSVHADLAEKSLGRSLDSSYDSYGSMYDAAYEYEEGKFNDAGIGESLYKELDSMTDDYEILDGRGQKISTNDYYKLDYVSQCECIIKRPDGTYIDLEEHDRGNYAG